MAKRIITITRQYGSGGREIGEKLNINRSTSYRHRRNSLEEIRKQLKEKKTNEE